MMQDINPRHAILIAIGIAILIALPMVVKSSFAMDIFIRILLFSFIGTAWNLMGGYAKQLSLGHAAYFGLGAYTSTILQINYDISPWIGMVAGGIVAMLMGINPNRVFCVALGIALALAGAAGSLLMPFYSAYPFVGQVFVLMAFVAVVLGTLGNVVGALVASLMMGIAESLGVQYVGADSGLIVVFAMLLFTLAFKPTGLGGGRAR